MKKKLLILFIALITISLLVFSACDKAEDNGGNPPKHEESKPCTITFDSDGGTTIEAQSVDKNTKATPPTDPIKVGYTFDGWYYGSEKWSFAAYTVTGDMTLKAKWNIVTYDITYVDPQGATNTNPETYTIENEGIILEDLSKLGYIFEGWYSNGTKVTSIPKGSYGEIELTAKWIPITYTITYNDQCGAENENPTNYTIEAASITLKDLSKDGYTFDGWYSNGTKVTTIPKGTYGEITLTAKWSVYTVTTNTNLPNAGTYTEYTNKNTTAGTSVTLTATTKEGYTWLGWYNGNEKLTTELTYTFEMPIDNVTYTAKWFAPPLSGSGGLDLPMEGFGGSNELPFVPSK